MDVLVSSRDVSNCETSIKMCIVKMQTPVIKQRSVFLCTTKSFSPECGTLVLIMLSATLCTSIIT